MLRGNEVACENLIAQKRVVCQKGGKRSKEKKNPLPPKTVALVIGMDPCSPTPLPALARKALLRSSPNHRPTGMQNRAQNLIASFTKAG